MALKFNGTEIPQWTTKAKISTSNEHMDIINNRSEHVHDPLGDLYHRNLSALKAAPMIEQMDIPQPITNEIISFLPCTYTESTLHLPRSGSWWHSNPTIEYGSEAMLLLTPPCATTLPSSFYTLDRISYALGSGEDRPSKASEWECKLFIGIQPFDKLKKPGYGQMVFAEAVDIRKEDAKFVIEPNIKLQCGKAYIFWATCIDGNFNASLIDGQKKAHIQCRNNCQLSNCNLNYYAYNGNTSEYRIRYDFMTAYDVQFSFNR